MNTRDDHPVMRIVSGGQTGADRAALDAAIEMSLPHGGFVPRGRRAEDGRIADHYELTEIESTGYDERTQRNVIASDATVIISIGPLTGGSAATRRFARKHDKPLLHIDLSARDEAEAADEIRRWSAEFNIRTLNVAGPRESTTPGIYAAVRRVLLLAFSSDAVTTE